MRSRRYSTSGLRIVGLVTAGTLLLVQSGCGSAEQDSTSEPTSTSSVSRGEPGVGLSGTGGVSKERGSRASAASSGKSRSDSSEGGGAIEQTTKPATPVSRMDGMGDTKKTPQVRSGGQTRAVPGQQSDSGQPLQSQGAEPPAPTQVDPARTDSGQLSTDGADSARTDPGRLSTGSPHTDPER